MTTHLHNGLKPTAVQEKAPLFDGRVPGPDFVNIETTRYCNFECPMCLQYQGGTTVTGPHIDLGVFESIAHSVFPFARRFQPSVSGEPLMSKGLHRIIELAAEYDVRMELSTNGSYFNKGRLLDLILPSLGKVFVSFDGATKETFEWIRSGSDFEEIRENVRSLCRAAKVFPEERRPVIGLVCVLMRRNIEELEDLVNLAAGLGVDFLAASHVHPVTDCMKEQSLVHHVELARTSIDRALNRARELQLPMMVQPLDQIIASAATGGAPRVYAADDGVVSGLEYRQVLSDRVRPTPLLEETAPESEAVAARRRAARARSRIIAQTPWNPEAAPRESIFVCDFLWNKIYIALDGNVRPCCVPGTPNLGNLKVQHFDALWNSEAYTRMREALVRKDPVPFCRGCQHIAEIHDPVEIDHYLQGRVAPSGKDNRPLPFEIDPARPHAINESQGPAGPSSVATSDQDPAGAQPVDFARPEALMAPPIFSWEALQGASGYSVQMSLDGFRSILSGTGSAGTELIQGHEHALPQSVWDELPRDATVSWRVLARLIECEIWFQVTSGAFRRA